MESNHAQACYLSISSFEPVVWLISSGKSRPGRTENLAPNSPGRFVSMFSHTTTCVQEPGSLIVLPPSCAYQYFSPQSSILWASFDSLSPQLEAFSAAVERQPVSAQPLSYQQQNDLLGGMMHRSNLTPPHASAALHDSQTLSSSGDYRDSRRNSRDSYSRDRPVVDSKELAEYKRDHHEKNTAAYRGGKPDSDRLDQNRSRSPEKGRGGDKDRRDDRDGRRDRSPDRKSDRRSRERSPDRRDKDRESSGSSKRSSHDDRRDDRDGKSDSYRRSDDRDRHRDRDDRDKERDRRRSSERDSHRDQDRDRHRERDRSRDRDDRNKRSTEQDKHHRSRHDDAADRSRSRGESGGSDRKRDKSRDRGTDRGRSRDRDSRSDLDRSGERVHHRDEARMLPSIAPTPQKRQNVAVAAAAAAMNASVVTPVVDPRPDLANETAMAAPAVSSILPTPIQLPQSQELPLIRGLPPQVLPLRVLNSNNHRPRHQQR
jgi:hypothetical protein